MFRIIISSTHHYYEDKVRQAGEQAQRLDGLNKLLTRYEERHTEDQDALDQIRTYMARTLTKLRRERYVAQAAIEDAAAALVGEDPLRSAARVLERAIEAQELNLAPAVREQLAAHARPAQEQPAPGALVVALVLHDGEPHSVYVDTALAKRAAESLGASGAWADHIRMVRGGDPLRVSAALTMVRKGWTVCDMGVQDVDGRWVTADRRLDAVYVQTHPDWVPTLYAPDGMDARRAASAAGDSIDFGNVRCLRVHSTLGALPVVPGA